MDGDLNSIKDWLQILSNLGLGGIAWYLLVIGLPKTNIDFKDTLRDQRTSFTTELANFREDHKKIVADIVASHRASVEAMCAMHERHIENLLLLMKDRTYVQPKT